MAAVSLLAAGENERQVGRLATTRDLVLQLLVRRVAVSRTTRLRTAGRERPRPGALIDPRVAGAHRLVERVLEVRAGARQQRFDRPRSGRVRTVVLHAVILG